MAYSLLGQSIEHGYFNANIFFMQIKYFTVNKMLNFIRNKAINTRELIISKSHLAVDTWCKQGSISKHKVNT